MAARTSLRPDDLKIGAVRNSRASKLAIAFRRGDAPYRIITENGELQSTKKGLIRRFSNIEGLSTVGSLEASILLAITELFTGTKDETTWRNTISSMVNGNISIARRAAVTLGEVGVPSLINLLPLSETELWWWTAVGYARRRDTQAAYAFLNKLPVDRYPDALPLLVGLASSHGVPDQNLAGRLFKDRCAGMDPPEMMRAMIRLGLVGAEHHWTVDTLSPPPPSTTVNSCAAVYAIVRGSKPAEGLVVRVPSVTPEAVVDELLDRGVQISIRDTTGIEEPTRRYLLARSSPSSLNARELDAIDFRNESIRRNLLRGELLEGEASPSASDHLRSAVRFVQDGTLAGSLERLLGTAAHDLRIFVADPRLEHLTEAVVGDPSLWPYLHRLLPADARHWDAPRNTGRCAFLAWVALKEATNALFDADWPEAGDRARAVLRLSADETFRDEALNIISFTCFRVGQDEAAMKALHSALEGSRNESLQVNLAIVASRADPRQGALELTRLVRESTNLELRAAAAIRAYKMWQTASTLEGIEPEEGLHPAVREALRAIATEPVDVDTFRAVIKILATENDSWLSAHGSLRNSVHRASVEAYVYSALATGLDEFVDALIKTLSDAHVPEWVCEERDAFVDDLTKRAMAESSEYYGLYALNIVEKGLPVSRDQYSIIVPLAIHSVCGLVDPSEGEPDDRFDTTLAEAERDARRDGHFEQVEELYDSAWHTLIRSRLLFASNLLDSWIDTYNDLLSQANSIPRHRLDMNAVRNAFRPVNEAAYELEKRLLRLPRQRTSDEEREFLDELLEQARDLKNKAREVMR